MKEPFGYEEFQKEQGKHLEEYLESRKSPKTREAVRLIIRKLTVSRNTDPTGDPGWVQSSDLYDEVVPEIIPKNSDSSFYKILDDLVNGYLIENKHGHEKRDRPGRKPQYYRVPAAYGSLYFMSNKELVKEVLESHENMGKVSMRLFAATSLLAQCHASEPDYNVRDAIKKETLRIFPDYGKVISSPPITTKKKN
jgi:hypothetical protein